MNQPQQSNGDLGPLREPPKVAPHDLTPSIAPILPEERQLRTWGGKVPHIPLQALPFPLPPPLHRLKAPNSTAPAPDTFFTFLWRIPVCSSAAGPLDARGARGARSGSALCSLPGGGASLSDRSGRHKPYCPHSCSGAILLFSKKPYRLKKKRSPGGRSPESSDPAYSDPAQTHIVSDDLRQ